MTILDGLRAEFTNETRTTRKHLARLPTDTFDWRPHAKSSTAGALASHIVECVGWVESIFSRDELDVDVTTFTPYVATSSDELLRAFDETVAKGEEALARASQTSVTEPWRLKIMGKVRFEKPRADVLRDFTLSHLIHHRGQLTVYLRLLDIPVPGSYGPTADERF